MPQARSPWRSTPLGARVVVLLLLLGCALLSAPACADAPRSSTAGSLPPSAAGAPASSTGSTQPTSAGTATSDAAAPGPDGSESLPAILARMDTRQKAAQLLLVGFPGIAADADLDRLLAEGPVGGVILYARNVESPEQVTALTGDLQRAAAAGGSGLPLLVAVDQEGGELRRIREGVPYVPGARAAAATLSPNQVRELSRSQARGLLRQGVNMNLAPVADVVDDPSSFLFARTYGGDPALVSSYVSAVVEGQEEEGLISVLKHFPGHGAAAGDTHTGQAVSRLGPEEFRAGHFLPFEAGIRAGAPAVLVSHVVAEGLGPPVPSSVSSRVIEGLLRGELGFDGVVVTDDIEMAGLPGGGAAAADAVLAGADLVIVGHTAAEQRAALEAVVAAVEDGRLPPARLDAAVLRVLRLKKAYGLL